MGMQNNERNPHIESINIGAVGAAATVTVAGFFLRKRSRIKNVWLIDTVLSAVDAVNFATVSLQDNAGTPIVYASGTTKLGVAALTQLAIPLAAGGGSGDDIDQATAPEVDVPAATMLNVKVVSSGTKTLTNALLCVEWYSL